MLHNMPILTAGPRVKTDATKQFEALIKELLVAHQQNQPISVQYNESGMVITVNQKTYPLTQIFNANPDFEQLEFNDNDLAAYESFLRHPKTLYKLLGLNGNNNDYDDVTPEEIKSMQDAFPNLRVSEMTPIRYYTNTSLYALMNYLTKLNAAPFPAFQPLVDLEKITSDKWNDIFPLDESIMYALRFGLLEFAIKYTGNPKTKAFDVNDPLFLAMVIKETLLHLAIASSALSKNIQDELILCAATSQAELQDQVKNTKGIGFAIVSNVAHAKEDNLSFLLVEEDHETDINGIHFTEIPSDMTHDLYLIGYGEVIKKLEYPLDLRALLAAHTQKNDNGVVLSEDEFKTLSTLLLSPDSFTLLENLPALAKTKLIDILLSQSEIASMLEEDIYRLEEDIDFYEKHNFPDINKLEMPDSYQFAKGFFSSSSEAQFQFAEDNRTNILFKLKNPITWGKNITALSGYPVEKERLIIHSQQITITNIYCQKEYDGYDQSNAINCICIEGLLTRSIGGITLFDKPKGQSNTVAISSSNDIISQRSLSQ